MEIKLLQDIAIIFSLAIVVLQVCHSIRLPAVIGFLFTGALVGPHGLHLIKNLHEVDVLAEIGVVLLLFTIGLEFSLKDLIRLKRTTLGGGILQVLITITAAAVIFHSFFNLPLNHTIFIGFLLTLSSTAIVLRLYQERAELDTAHGQTVFSILIFQDIIVVLLMLLTPFLAGAAGTGKEMITALIVLLGKGGLILAAVFVSARYVVPHFLFLVARTRSRELFLLSIAAVCLLTAWLTSLIGLSLGLGAFLAGLIISESEYGTAALGNMTPFRDMFMSFFFVSIGMLLNINIVFAHPQTVVGLAIAVFFVKALVILLVGLIIGVSLRSTIIAAMGLAQIGEFSFVLSRFGLKYNFFIGDQYQIFLAVAVISMAITPFLVSSAPHLAAIVLRLPLPDRLKIGMAALRISEETSVDKNLENHLIIIGYGLNGQNLARAAMSADIPYVIIETNPDTVRRERKLGSPIIYGDATHDAVLEHAQIKTARVAVIAISDPVATRHITRQAKHSNLKLHLIVRTRFVIEIDPLIKLGADEVIPEEYETAVEIFTHVLNHYLVPQQDIDRFNNEIRADSYQMLRGHPPTLTAVCDMKGCLADSEIKVVLVEENSPFCNKSLAEIGIRRYYGVTVLAVRRKDETLENPDPETELIAGNALILFGPPEKIGHFMKINSAG